MRNGFNPLLTFCLAFALASSALGQAPRLSLDLGGGETLPTVLIPRGSFTQGSPDSEPGREADETSRPVTLTQAFYGGAHVVTRGQFARFVAETGYKTEAEKGTSGGFGVVNGALAQQPGFHWRNPGFPQTDAHPVVLVTYDDALAFCAWLGKKSRREVTLPTEAQWEYACRAGTAGPRYAEPLDAVARHKENAGGTTTPVGTLLANPWGLHDLHGGVWQWCLDWYAPYRPGAATDPYQTESNLSDKPRRVLRGGSFLSGPARARSAERYRNDSRARNADNGFRIVCSVQEVEHAATGSSGGASSASSRSVTTANPPASSSGPGGNPTSGSKGSASSSGGSGSKSGGGSAFFGLFILVTLAVVAFSVVKKLLGFFSGASRVVSSAAGAAAAMTAAASRSSSAGLTGPELADALSQPMSLDTRYRVRPADSGFFITGESSILGRRLRYHATAAGRVYTDDITFHPGPEGHFIFTGSRPESVTVRVLDGGSTTSETLEEGDRDRHHRRENNRSDEDAGAESWDDSDSRSTHRSHPPAY